jgi:hypothetical protein
MIGRDRAGRVEAQGDGAIAAGGNIENVRVHVGDVYAMDALPLKAAVLDHSSALADADLDHFVGREWLIDQIDQLVSVAGDQQSSGRYVLIRARAGMGKTALAGWLSRYWDCACHFTRTVGGRDTRTALQSLAAQLIVRYGMHEEFAPGGMLASWVGDPARFPAVLAAAAQRAAVHGDQVRIVVDGLDEADGDGPALGLPPSLPAGTVILATYREGVPQRRIPRGDAVNTVSIDAHSAQNRADIRRFLSAEVQDDTIAARLASAGLSQQDAIAVLEKRCDGVWIYLRYVLSRLRIDPHAPVDLDALPTGLAAYYRQEVTGHRDSPRFFTCDLPVLSTLAVAGQPMSRDQISRLSEVPTDQVRWLCDVRYRPFLALDTASSPPRYSIYHASLREFLHGNLDPDDPGQDPIDAHDLSEAVGIAHRRICDHYLTRFGGLYGGLDRCLPALRSDPTQVDIDQRYPLRHLPTHLHRAGLQRELDMLLACRQRPRAQLGSLWLDAHDRAGTLDDYLAALTLARDIAEHETDRLIAAGRPAVTIAAETRCAVLAANLIRSDAIPATLLDALARTGVWNVARALWHAHRKHDPRERAEALTALVCQVGDDHDVEERSGWTRAEILDHALDAARTIRIDWDRPAALAEVAVQLAEPARSNVLGDALATAVAIEDPAYRQRAFAAVADRLVDSGQLGRAVHAALAVSDPSHRAELLAAIAPRLPEPDRSRLLDRALDLALGITSPVPAARVLAKLAAALPDPTRHRVLQAALDAALAAPTWCQATPIIQVVESMDDPAQLSRALAVALAVANHHERAAALTAVAARLTEPERVRILQQALDAALAPREEGEDEGKRTRAMLTVAAQLPNPARSEMLGQVLDTISAIRSIAHRGWALSRIATHLTNPAQVSQALDIALRGEYHGHRTTAITNVGAQLTEPVALGRVLDAACAIEPESDRADAVTTIAVGLTDPIHLDRAADIARTITDTGPRSRALAAVAIRMAEPGRTNVLDEAFDAIGASTRQPWNQMRALRAMAADAAGPAHQDRMINAALGITDAEYRSEALVAVADQLAEPTRTAALEQAATAARAVTNVNRLQRMVAVATSLTGPNRARLLDELLDQAATTTSDLERARTVAAVAELIVPAQLARARTAALACVQRRSWAQASAAVAARLAEPTRSESLAEALDTAIAVFEQRDRAWALAAVAKHLTASDQLDRAVAAAIATADADWVYALVSATPNLPAPQRNQALARALDRATSDIMHPGPAGRQVSVISNELTDPDQLGRALDLALLVEPDPEYGPGPWIMVFRRVARLATDISPTDTVRLLRRAFHTLPRSSVVLDIIGAIAPATARIGGQEALIGQLDLIL